MQHGTIGQNVVKYIVVKYNVDSPLGQEANLGWLGYFVLSPEIQISLSCSTRDRHVKLVS